jgi:thiol-disulfide isomerase/thioredoxin
MNRRHALILVATLPFAAQMARAAAADVYSPEAVAAALAAGKTVVLDFAADWCPSCQSQGRTIARLRDENPAWADSLAFFVVDWDTYKDSDLARRYGIINRGSLVLLKGDRVLTQTSTHSTEDALKAMFDQASG